MTEEQPNLTALIDAQATIFKRPGVLSVRPGYRIANGWLTGQRAIVVTVRQKRSDVPGAERLPTEVAGVPVDVREASERKRYELERPIEYAEQLRLSPDLGAVPHFADERVLSGERPVVAPSAHAQLAAIAKPGLPYSGPDGIEMTPIEAEATLVLSASPDAGWPTLRSFVQATERSLTVGLYDFTSAHVLSVLQDALAGRQLKLVLDHPARNPTADQTDAESVAALRQSLQADLAQAWALSRMDKNATAWIYPTAYHIKVAVRDSAACWLSSGNWNNSNQPDLDPIADPAARDTARHRDRDWHVVIHQPRMAKLFEAYLLHDLEIATSHNGPPEQPGLPLSPAPLGHSATPAYVEFFPSKTVHGRIRLTPLLTPDPGVYAGAVKALIASARKTLYLQFQYIELPRAVNDFSRRFVDLVQAVIDRQNAGVDVKIIMSQYEVAGYLEQLQSLGLNVVDNVKLQNNVHNKGIIVDGRAVLVSSQNWSTDGTLYNCDAGVIIHNRQAAEYFQQIFLHDWNHLAAQKVVSD